VGCRTDAKWTALKYLNEARKDGALITEQLDVKKVIISKKRAVGIAGINSNGKAVRLFANTVILAAGGIGTPVILQNSGIRAGQKLFLDLFTVTFGLAEKSGMRKELPMAAVCHRKGFILSPYIDNSLFALASTVPLPLRRNIGLVANHNRMLGVMVKINDDASGKIRKNGNVEKTATSGDLAKLAKGQSASKKILIEAGARPDSIITSRIRGAHPGGTAAIGEVVNKNLETKVKGLYVCDASVLPVAPGLPPIVTIIALAKRFSKSITS
jgi:choline dehydrogenase-like flavoprotein